MAATLGFPGHGGGGVRGEGGLEGEGRGMGLEGKRREMGLDRTRIACDETVEHVLALGGQRLKLGS